MANALLTPTAVTREALRILHQKLNFVGTIERQYDASFAKEGAKIGSDLKIRLPNEYVVTDGAALSAQDTQEKSVTLQVSSQKHVGMNFSTAELALSMDDFSERIIEPAMSVLAANVEADAMSMYKDVSQSIWNGGAALTYNKVLDGRVLLNRSLAPASKRTANLNSLDMADVIKDTKTLFQDDASIAKQYREGMVGRAGGFDFAENTMWAGHARGGANTAYTTDTRTSALATDGTAYATITLASGSGTIKRGDVFTIANVHAVHPETKESTGVLQQFVCTGDSAGGAGDIGISPAIVLGGARQNVTISSNSATAGLTFAGTASTTVGTSLLYQKEAFAFATADLVMPRGVDFSAREVLDGVSLRIVRQYDINNDKLPCRVDILYGYKTLRPQLAARLHNN